MRWTGREGFRVRGSGFRKASAYLFAAALLSSIACQGLAAENVAEGITGPVGQRVGALGCSVGLGMNRGGGNWPMLGRGEQENGAYWGGLVIGTFVPDGAPQSAPMPKQEQPNWILRRFNYTFNGGRLAVTASLASPFILFETDVKGFTLFGNMAQAHDAFQYNTKPVTAMEKLAFVAGGKIETHGAGTDVATAGMSEAWMLVWFDPTYDYDFFRGCGAYTGSQAPAMLVVFQHKPTTVKLDAMGLHVAFTGEAGVTAVTPLFGHRILKRGELTGWAAELPVPIADRTRKFTALSRAIPVNVVERSVVAGQDLTVTDSFEFRDIADDWKTPANRSSPLPPALAAAMHTRFPVEAQQRIDDPDYTTVTGPLYWAENAPSLTYTLPGILKYVQAEPKPPAAVPARYDKYVAELQSRMAKLADGKGTFRANLYNLYGFWRPNVCWVPGERLLAMAEAYPYCPAELQKKSAVAMKELAKQVAMALSAGNSLAIPREIRDGETRATIDGRDRARFGVDLYALDRYAQVTGDLSAVSEETAAAWLAQLLRDYNWQTLADTRPVSVGVYDSPSTWAAGLIGLSRLAHRNGWNDLEARATHFAAMALVSRYARGEMADCLYDYNRIGPFSVNQDGNEISQENVPTLLPDGKYDPTVRRETDIRMAVRYESFATGILSKPIAGDFNAHMTPEVGAFLRDFGYARHVRALDSIAHQHEAWWVGQAAGSDFDSRPEEHSYHPFMAFAYSTDKSADWLEKRLPWENDDDGASDVYRLRALVALLAK